MHSASNSTVTSLSKVIVNEMLEVLLLMPALPLWM